jgi:DnaK suppressor protein
MCKEKGSNASTDGIRRQLLAERAELLSKAKPPAVTNTLSPDERDSDEADAAVSTAYREHAMWLVEDTRQKLELIDQALQRIDEGKYGRCVTCGGAINPERLEALPYTTQCVRCQEQAERGGRRQTRGRDIME